MKLNKNPGIKWKLFIYLLAFALFMLALLWLFQTVLLDRFYQSIKIRNIISTADSIARNIDSEDLMDQIYSLELRDDISLRIIDPEGQDLITSTRPHHLSNIFLMNSGDLRRFYELVEQNGGSYLERFQHQPTDTPYGDWRMQILITDSNTPNTAKMLVSSLPPDDANSSMTLIASPWSRINMQSLIYARIVTDAEEQNNMILLSAPISPVWSTVDTLRLQLIYISIIFIVLALGLALFMSINIARPIIKINRSAKELARGHYGVRFEGTGYQEIAELSDTLNHAADELGKVESLRRELIANVSHDMRTPLTMISGYAEAMRDLPGENTPENLQLIIDEVQRLNSLVNDTLDLSQLQTGSQTLKWEEFNLTTMIDQILLRYSKLIEHNGYQIDYIHDAEQLVYADEIKITQVIYNLINNALTYTGENRRVVVTQTIQSQRVRIEICDNGTGIPGDEIPYIWERYYRVQGNHRRAAIGTGLGLSIVRSILELHGSPYGVDSEEGKGSTFWFELSQS